MAGVKLRTGKIDELIALYEQAYKDIVKTIIGATEAGKIRKAQTLATIKAQLTELGVNFDKWVKEEIPQYYLDGANKAVQDLTKMGYDVTSAKGLLPINKEAIASLTSETSLAFAQSLTAVMKNATTILGQAYRQQLNFIIADGQLKGDALRTVTANVKQKLEDQGISALTDKAGKNWTLENYADMLVRTKAVEARNAGLADKMLQNGYDLVEVSADGDPCPYCLPWQYAILSLTGNTDGYPTLTDATTSGLFHPRCKHAINPINLDLAQQTEAYDNPFDYTAKPNPTDNPLKK